jgi:hypothetical protein
MYSLALVLSMCFATQDDVPEGSIVLVANAGRLVQWSTGSPLSHSAIILRHDGELYVYEATVPVVRRTRLAEYVYVFQYVNPYLRENRRPCVEMGIATPNVPYTEEQLQRMRGCAEGQLGTKYRLMAYYPRSRRGRDGIHCTQFVAGVLLASGRYRVQDFGVSSTARTSPRILWDTLSGDHQFTGWRSPAIVPATDPSAIWHTPRPCERPTARPLRRRGRN